MISTPLRALFLVLLVVAVGAPVSQAGDEVALPDDRIFPLSAVRPGMRATVHTVFSGTRLETFEVEVVDVMQNFLPKQNVILVRCIGDKVEHTGIAEGMSGSPVTIDGKMVGALAYTWEWSKDPLGGVTPIESMIADGERPLEGRPSGAYPETELQRPHPVPSADLPDTRRGFRRIATPVCVAGYSEAGQADLVEAFADVGLPVRMGGGVVAGAAPGWANLDAPVVPGAALSVDLVRGDYSMAALGTCTYVDGDKVYAFGHGFQDMGETLFPLSVAYVYSVIPKLSLSFKMGNSIREVGALVQDRQSGIMGRLGAKAPMVPFDVTLRNEATGRAEEFHFEITANRSLFQRLMILTLREAFSKAERTLGYNTKRYKMEVKLKGVEEVWRYGDAIVGFDSGLSRILVGLADRVAIHPMQRAAFEWVKLDVSIENVDRRASIVNVTPVKDEVRRGEEVDLLVRMQRREGGGIFVERLSIRVPADAPPGNLVLTITGGDSVPADIATPVDIVDTPKLYDAFYKATELFALIPTSRVNLDMDGRLLRNMPHSVVARLARSPLASRVKVTPVTEKVRRKVSYIVSGTDKVVLRVLP